MLANQQQSHLVLTRLNNLLSSCSDQLPTIDKILRGIIYIHIFSCSFQNIPQTVPRDMCIRIHPVFSVSVDVVLEGGDHNIWCLSCKNFMEGHQYFSLNTSGMKYSSKNNLVQWLALLVQTNAGGSDGF